MQVQGPRQVPGGGELDKPTLLQGEQEQQQQQQQEQQSRLLLFQLLPVSEGDMQQLQQRGWRRGGQVVHVVRGERQRLWRRSSLSE